MFLRRRAQYYSDDELRWHLHKRLRSIRAGQIEGLRRSGKVFSARLHPPANAADRPDRQDVLQKSRPISFKALTLIEAGLIATLVIMIFSGLRSLERTNQTARESWLLPAITATPLVRPVLLPSEHTPVNAKVVEDPRELVVHGLASPIRKAPLLSAPPVFVAEFSTRIQIPAIGVDAPIVQGVESEQLKKGVGQVPGTANPGQKGNLVLSAHNDIYGELFRYLDRLKSGDQFTIFTNLRVYTYVITGWELVDPTRVEVLAPTLEATATLISCYPYLIDTMRIIVRARLVEG